MFRTNNGGKHWTAVNNDLTSKSVKILYSDGSSLYAGILDYDGGIFKTSDGVNWVKLNTSSTASFYITDLYSDGVSLYQGNQARGVFKTSDGGKNWIEVNNGLTNKSVHTLYADSSNLYVGTEEGVFKSNDGGANWTRVTTIGLTVPYINALYSNDGNLYAGTNGGGVFRINGSGVGWEPTKVKVGTYVTFLYTYNGDLYAGTRGGGVFKSDDGGANWTQSKCKNDLNVGAIYSDSDYLYVAFNDGVCKTNNGGELWVPINNGLKNDQPNFQPVSLHAFNGYLYLGIDSQGVYRTNDGGLNWQEVGGSLLDGTIITDLYSSKSYLYAGKYTMATGGTSVFKTSGGASVSWISAGLDDTLVSSLYAFGDYLFAGSKKKGMLRTDDGGASWIPMNHGLTDLSVVALHSYKNYLYTAVGGVQGNVFKTNDSGENWTQVSDNLNLNIWDLCSDDNGYLYVGYIGYGGREGYPGGVLKIKRTWDSDN